MDKYSIRLLPSDIDIKKAKYILYKGEIYNHLPDLRREDKDPNIFTFIQKENDVRGYHEKWNDLLPLELFVCSKNINIGTEFWVPTTNGWLCKIADHIKDGYIYCGLESIRYNINWIYKKECLMPSTLNLKNGDPISRELYHLIISQTN